MNDNAPQFQTNFNTARVSETAPRGHLVAKVHAFDPDVSDSLRYSIVGLDSHQDSFHVDEKTGISRFVSIVCL